MKKFLSYLLVFVTVFVISTTITIKVKSELLDSSAPTITAGASGETSLLGGMMNSFEENPKLSINGTIDLFVGEKHFNIALAAVANLATLTSPEIDANITINYNQNSTELRVVFVNGTIYISHANIQIKAALDDISSAVESVGELFENVSLDLNVSADSSFIDSIKEKVAGISVDSLIDALSNPKKTILEDLDEYEVTLPNICKLYIVCDEQFNISTVKIDSFELIDNVDVNAELFVSQDSNLSISEPAGENYFDIASAIRGVGELFSEDYLRVDAWASLYKGGELKENMFGYALLDTQNSKYSVNFELKGKIEADLSATFVDDVLYANLNDINLSANKSTIEQLVGLVKQKISEIELDLPEIELSSIVDYIKQNYQQILSDATILNGQIKVKLDLSSFVQGLSDLSVLIDFNEDYKISKLNISGLNIEDYSLVLSTYFSYPENLDIQKQNMSYLCVEEVLELVDTFKNLERFELSGSADIKTSMISQNFDFAVVANAKTKEFSAQISNLFGLNINVAYLDSQTSNYPMFLNVGDIYLTSTKDYMASLVGNKLEELLSGVELPQSEQIVEFAKSLLQKYWIGDVLKLSNIVVEDGHIKIESDLTALVGKVCKFEFDAEFTNSSISISKLDVKFEENKISLALDFKTTEKLPTVENQDKYLDARWIMNYVQSFISSEDLLLSGNFSVQKDGENLVGFDGQIGLEPAGQNFVIDGNINSIISGNARVVYKNQQLYLDYGAQHFNVSKQGLVDIVSALGYDAAPYVQKAEDIISQVASLDIYNFVKEKIDELDLSSVNISEIDFASLLNEEKIQTIVDLISSVKIDARNIELNAENAGVNVDAKLSLFSKLGIVADVEIGDYHIDANLVLSKEAANYQTSENSVCLDPVADLVPTIQELLNYSTFEGTAIISFGDKAYEKLSANYKLSVDLQQKLVNAQITLSVCEREIDIFVENNELYISFSGIKVSASLDEILEILKDELFNEIVPESIKNIDLSNISKEDILNKIISLLEEKTLVNSLEKVGDVVNVGLLNEIEVALSANSEELVADITYKNINANISVNAVESVEFDQINKSEFMSVGDVFNIVKNAYNFALGKAYYANVNLSIAGYDISGYVGYDQDGIVADLSTTIFERQANVKIVDRVVYVSFDGFNAKLSFAEAAELLRKVVSVFAINIDQTLLDTICGLLEGQEIELSSLVETFGTELSIEDIIAEIELNLSQNMLSAKLLGADIDVILENDNISKIDATYSSEKLSLVASVILTQKKQVTLEQNYVDLADAKNILSTISDIISQKQLAGSINIHFDKIDIDGTYQLSFEDELKLLFSFNAYGLDVEVALVNNTLYLAIEDIKVKASLDNIGDIIDWINQTFGTEIEFDLSSLSAENLNISELLNKIDLSKLSLSLSDHTISAGYGELSVSAELNNSLALALTYQKQAAEGEEQRKPLIITLDGDVVQTDISVADEEYEPYSILTDLVDSVMQIIDSKKVSVTLPNIKVYEGTSVHYTASGSLQVDWSDSDNLLFHAQVVVRDNQKGKDYDVRLSYRNDYWWIYFNNLKVKMSKADVNELLVIILKVMDIDTTLIPGLAEISANLDDINFDSLSAILPNFKDFSPFDLLGYITDLKLEGGRLVCDIDSSLVTDNPNATNMRVVVDASNGRLSSIIGENIYTGVTNAEHFDININIDQNFAGVGAPASGNYLDLSGSNELIKALFNTAELNYFNVSGTIAASLGSWELVDIPLVLQVKLDENRKPIIYAKLDLSVLTDSLISSAANAIVFEKNYRNNHIVEIYYKDGYVYFHSSGNSSSSLFSSATYVSKMLKVHIDSVLEDPMYYLEFALSFSDTIEGEITKSIERNADHKPDLGKIINYYKVTNSRNFEISLDMEEISGDSVLSDTIVDIGVINNSSTGGKNYIGTAGFDFQLSVGLTIHISSDNLKLVNIGQAINFASIENFINNYAYGEGREMSSTNGGSSYSVSGGKQYSVTFESNGGAGVSKQTNYPGTTFTLPVLANKVVSAGGTKDVYKFVGWYEDSTLIKTPYTQGVIGHTNITVYAKWELIEQYRTINFYLDGALVSSKLSLVGSEIAYDGLAQTRIVENGGYKYYQSFERYADANGNTVSVVGESNQNVYITYANTNVLKAYTLSFDSGLAPAVDSKQVYETESYANLLPNFETVLIEEGDTTYFYSFDGWFVDENKTVAADGIMPSSNLVLHAKLTFLRSYTVKTLAIFDNNQKVFEERIEVGAQIVLPNSIKVDGNTQWYTTAGYTLQVSLPETMPNENTILHIRNRYKVTYTYYSISNHSSLGSNTKTENLYQGEAFNYPAQTNDYIDYKNSSNVLDYRLYYTFNGYKNGSETYDSMPNHDVNLTSAYSTTRKNYYTISFDMTLDYIPKLCAIGCSYVSTPSTPASLRLLEGSVVDLKQSKYQITVKIKATAVGWTKYTYKSTTWGTSKHSDYSDGGDGVTSWTVSGNATLKPYWKKQ